MNKNLKKLVASPLLDRRVPLPPIDIDPCDIPPYLMSITTRLDNAKIWNTRESSTSTFTASRMKVLREQFKKAVLSHSGHLNHRVAGSEVEDCIYYGLAKAESKFNQVTDLFEYLRVILRHKSIDYLSETSPMNRCYSMVATFQPEFIKLVWSSDHLSHQTTIHRSPALFGFISPHCRIQRIKTYEHKIQDHYLKKLCNEFPDTLFETDEYDRTILHIAGETLNLNAIKIILTEYPEDKLYNLIIKQNSNGDTMLHTVCIALSNLKTEEELDLGKQCVRDILSLFDSRIDPSMAKKFITIQNNAKCYAIDYIIDTQFQDECRDILLESFSVYLVKL